MIRLCLNISASFYPLLSPNFMSKIRKILRLNFHQSPKNLIFESSFCCLQSLVGPLRTISFFTSSFTDASTLRPRGGHTLHITHSRFSRFSRFSDTQRSPSFLFIIIRLVGARKDTFGAKETLKDLISQKVPFKDLVPFLIQSFIQKGTLILIKIYI